LISILNKKAGIVKVRNSLKALKKLPGAQIVHRRGRVFVINKKNPRLKARQG
jgi:large subunit ribosomal protein L36